MISASFYDAMTLENTFKSNTKRKFPRDSTMPKTGIMPVIKLLS